MHLRAFIQLSIFTMFLGVLSLPLHAETVSPTNSNPWAYEGNVDAVDCTRVYGWAWNAANNAERVSLILTTDTGYFDYITADKFRGDLAFAGKGDGYHSFQIPTPTYLLDGRRHIVSIQTTSGRTHLSASPRQLTCTGIPRTCPAMKIGLVNNTSKEASGAISGYGNPSGYSTGWSKRAYQYGTMQLDGFKPYAGAYQLVADIQWLDHTYNRVVCQPHPVTLPHEGYCPNGDNPSVYLVVNENPGPQNGNPEISCELVATGF